MWKWILAGIVAAVGVAIIVVFFIAQIEPQGFAEFFIALSRDFDVNIGGERSRVSLSKLGDGVETEDYTYVIRKMLALLGKALLDPEQKTAYQEYCRALVEAGEDKTLDREEFFALRDMLPDAVTEEEIENWLDVYEELKKTGKEHNVFEVLGD